MTGSIEIGTVVSAHDLYQVLALVVVIDAADVTGGCGRRTGTTVGSRGLVTLVDGVMRVEIAVFTGGGEGTDGVEGSLCRQGGVDVMVAGDGGHIVGLNATIILKVLVPGLGIGRRVLVVLLVLVGAVVIQVDGLDEVALLSFHHVEGTGSLEGEALEERSFILEIQVVAHGDVAVLVGTGHVRIQQGHDVALAVEGPVLRIVQRMHGNGTVCIQHIVQGVLNGVTPGQGLGHEGDGGLIAHGQGLGELGGEVAGKAVAVPVTVVGTVDGVLLVKVGAQVVLGLLVTAADGEVVHLGEGVALVDGIKVTEVHVPGVSVAVMFDKFVGI